MRKRRYLIAGSIFTLLFIVFTLLVSFVDRQPVGPNDSVVGLATINVWFHNLTGVDFTLYDLTDAASIPAVLSGVGFAIFGLCQWIKRKSLKKVDNFLIKLGVFYIVVLLIYVLFEVVKINYRPVLIDGVLETSYPSSTTFLAITFMIASAIFCKKYFINKNLLRSLYVIEFVYMAFLVGFRCICGVHWLTDVIASVLIGLGVSLIFRSTTIRDTHHSRHHK